MAERERARTRTREGVVVSNAMDKTIVVSVRRRVRYPRYRKTITYTPIPAASIAVVEPGSAGLAGESSAKAEEKPAAKPEEKKEEPPPQKKGFASLGRVLSGGGGGEKKSAQVSAAQSARGVDPERDAKGGPNPKPVVVTLSAADVAAFKKEGGLT